MTRAFLYGPGQNVVCEEWESQDEPSSWACATRSIARRAVGVAADEAGVLLLSSSTSIASFPVCTGLSSPERSQIGLTARSAFCGSTEYALRNLAQRRGA